MVRSMIFFKNVKLMFWAKVVLCAIYVKNRCPSHVIQNKTPYKMWYGHTPSIRHLSVFGSTCYALIPKQKRKKLDARSCKCIFLGCSDTTKAYHLYNEANKKFIPSRDVIFLESTKSDDFIERQFNHLEMISPMKNYHEFDNEIPNVEGGNPILGQSLQSPSIEPEPTPPDEEVSKTSSNLDDVISIIEKLNIDDATPSEELSSPSPSPKQPKWLIKTIESVHLGEIGKTRTRSSTRDDNGGANSGDIDDLNTLYNGELNFYVDFEPTSIKEVTSHDEWK